MLIGQMACAVNFQLAAMETGNVVSKLDITTLANVTFANSLRARALLTLAITPELEQDVKFECNVSYVIGV